ncbi:MAG: FecR domain-containing protein [Magnetococcales bacterium]|nr:FecR domain-containing protein [Magnetococcales bacterium]
MLTIDRFLRSRCSKDIAVFKAFIFSSLNPYVFLLFFFPLLLIINQPNFLLAAPVQQDPAVATDEKQKKNDPIHIGRVLNLLDKVEGQIGADDKKQLEANEKIFAGEVITTGKNSSVVLKFRDGSTFNIGADAKVTLDEFVFNPLESVTNNTISVGAGAFSYTSGFSVKTPKTLIRVPTVSIGVRGTVVEGIVTAKNPDFIDIPVGEAQAVNSGGKQEITTGQSLAVLDEKSRPMDPERLVPAMLVDVIALIQDETSTVMPALVPLTKEQYLEDAKANREPINKQQIKGAHASFIPTFKNASLQIKHLVNKAIATVNKELVFIANSLAFVKAVNAASVKDISVALKSLRTAAKLGLLGDPAVSFTNKQLEEQKKFIQQVKKRHPNAAKILQQNRENKKSANRKNKRESTKQVISGSASVAKDRFEVAAVVASAVGASTQGDQEIATDIIASALTAPGLTDNADAAATISGAAAQADPSVAENIAATALVSLPESEQQKATIQIATSVVLMAPDMAARIAGAVTKVANNQDAALIASVITKAVDGKNAGEIAGAVAKEAKPENAGDIAAAVTKIAGADQAGDITAMVVENAGPDVASAVAASVTYVAGTKYAIDIAVSATQAGGPQVAAGVAASVIQIAGANSAASIAYAVVRVAGESIAGGVASAATQVARAKVAADIAAAVISAAGDGVSGIVAALVTKIAGDAVSEDIIQAIANASGQSVDEINASMIEAANSATFLEELKTAVELANKAIEHQQQAIIASKNALEYEKQANTAIGYARSETEKLSKQYPAIVAGKTGSNSATVTQRNATTTIASQQNSGQTSSNRGQVAVDDVTVAQKKDINKPVVRKPTAINISPSSLDENINVNSDVLVGVLTTTDKDIVDTHSYTITGGEDQDLFYISDDKLYIYAGNTVDYNQKETLSVSVRTIDSDLNAFDQLLVINVNDINEALDVITLNKTNPANRTNEISGTVLGSLSHNDPDAGDEVTFTVKSAINTHRNIDASSLFTISGNKLKITRSARAALDYITTFTVTVQGVDRGGLGGEADFTVTVIPTSLDINSLPDTDTASSIKVNSRVLFNNIRSTLRAGNSFSLYRSDLLTLILGKLEQQFTGGFAYKIDEIIESIGANISEEEIITIIFNIKNLEEINAKLNGDGRAQRFILYATSGLTDFIDVDSVNVIMQVKVNIINRTTVGFDANNSTIQIISNDGTINQSYKVSELIAQYNSTISYLPSNVKFFTSRYHIPTGKIPYNYDLNASGNYLGGLLSNITFNDGSIELTP